MKVFKKIFMEERWYKIVDLARELGVTEQTIRNWIVKGKVTVGEVDGRKRVRLSDGVKVIVG